MSKWFLGMMVFMACVSVRANSFELGILVGDPTGISALMDIEPNRAVDMAIGGSARGTHVHADYLLFQPGIIRSNQQFTPVLYYGVGGRVIHINSEPRKDQTSLALRLPVGLNQIFAHDKINFFIELSGNMDLVPAFNFDFDVGLGVRFKF